MLWLMGKKRFDIKNVQQHSKTAIGQGDDYHELCFMTIMNYHDYIF